MAAAKTYLAYEANGYTGLIVSPRSGVHYIDKNNLLVGQLENLRIIDTAGKIITDFEINTRSEITSVAVSAPSSIHNRLIFTGHQDGTVKIFETDGTMLHSLHGHTTSVTKLIVSNDNARFLSCSNDASCICWSVEDPSSSASFRLREHSAPVNDAAFYGDYIITVSKDTKIKVWNTKLKLCVQTLVNHTTEIKSVAVDHFTARVFTLAVDGLIHVWHPVDDKDSPLSLIGAHQRRGKNKIISMEMHDSLPLLIIHGEKDIELLPLASERKIVNKLKRRTKRGKNTLDLPYEPSDVFTQGSLFTMKEKIANVSPLTEKSRFDAAELKLPSGDLPKIDYDHLNNIFSTSIVNAAQEEYIRANIDWSDLEIVFAVAYTNNSLDTMKLSLKPGYIPDRITQIYHNGHSVAPRHIIISDDDEVFWTASNNEIKTWNTLSRQCIHSVIMEQQISAVVMLPDNRHAAVATKEGSVLFMDTVSGEINNTIRITHTGITALTLATDKTGLFVGTNDKKVVHYDFTVKKSVVEGRTINQIALSESATLELHTIPTSIAVTPDNKFLVIALDDNTARIHFLDTYRYHLTLFGHNLPIYDMSISADSTLLATASGDKTVKIWGLDFGDLHRSLRHHTGPITSVSFVGKTHYVVASSTDGTISEWDADKFKMIQVLEGHFDMVWRVQPSSNGRFFISAAGDKSIRFWKQGYDFITQNSSFDKQIETEVLEATSRDNKQLVEEGTTNLRSLDSIAACEALIRALNDVEKGVSNPLLANKKPWEYVMMHLRDFTKADDVTDVLRQLTLTEAITLGDYIVEAMYHHYHLEFCIKSLSFLIRHHIRVFLQNDQFSDVAKRWNESLVRSTELLKNLYTQNFAALNLLMGMQREELFEKL